MTDIVESSGHPKALANFLRPVSIATIWLVVVSLATALFFAPRGAEVQPTLHDVVGFGGSMAIAGASAATSAFGVGGRRRWAVELSSAVLVLGTTVALLLLYVLWCDPLIARQRLDLQSFNALQSGARRWAEQLAGYHGPLGTSIGITLGAVAGLLIRLGRTRPRMATSTGLVLLFATASDPVRRLIIAGVTWLGWILRYHFVPGSVSDDQIAITGMIFGAIAGSVIAALALYATRPRPMSSEPVGPRARLLRERARG